MDGRMSTPAKHTAFTPGPWTTGAGSRGIAVVARGWEVPLIATVAIDGHSTDAALANSRLIVSAPDMHKILDEVFDFLGQVDCDDEIRAVEIRERILAVLSKASAS